MNGLSRELLKLVANKAEYIEALKEEIWNSYECRAAHVGSVPVREKLEGKTVWEGEVEVFSIVGHSKCRRVYAWANLQNPKDDKSRFVMVLELPQSETRKAPCRRQLNEGGPCGLGKCTKHKTAQRSPGRFRFPSFYLVYGSTTTI